MTQVNYNPPRIMECLHFTYEMLLGDIPSHRIVKNYEIDINVTGERVMNVNGKSYKIEPGSVVCRTPGQDVVSFGNYNMYTLTLDFFGEIADYSKNVADRNSFSEFQPLSDSYYWDTIPTYFIPAHSADLLKMYQKLSIIWKNPKKKKETDNLLASILHLILSDSFAANVKEDVEIQPIFSVISYINEHYKDKISLDKLASVATLNKSYLVRLFRREIGTTPMDYLNHVRLTNAKKMLLNSNVSLKDIADNCGFDTVTYFIMRFEKMFGSTPGAYRKANQNI